MTYTLDDIERLAREFVAEQKASDEDMLDWTFSIFVAWLRQREMPTNDNLLQFNLVKEVGGERGV